MAEPGETSPEIRREQHKDIAAKRWESWGAELNEVVSVIGAQAAAVLGRKKPLTERQILDLVDATGDLFHPSRGTLDAIKAARTDQGESS